MADKKLSTYDNLSSFSSTTKLVALDGSPAVNKNITKAVLDGYITSLVGSSGGSSPISSNIISADVESVDVALIPALSFNVLANHVYEIDLKLLYRTTSTSTGIKVGIAGSAGYQSITVIARGLDSSGNSVTKMTKTLNDGLSFPTSYIGGDGNLLEVSGIAYCVSAGTLTLNIGSVNLYEYCAAMIGSGGYITDLGSIS